MSDCKDANTNTKDCEECQKTLKDHLRKCADYGKLPAIVTKCADLPGGCSVGKPDSCPAPPESQPPCPPPKCDVPPTPTFNCPPDGCAEKKDPCAPPPPPAGASSKCCPPPPTRVEQCPPRK